MNRIVLAAALVLACAAPRQDPAQPPPPPHAGDAAPAFRLNDHRGEVRSVGGESEGWTVLAFYPKALTPG